MLVEMPRRMWPSRGFPSLSEAGKESSMRRWDWGKEGEADKRKLVTRSENGMNLRMRGQFKTSLQ